MTRSLSAPTVIEGYVNPDGSGRGNWAHSLLTENDQPLRGTRTLRDAGRVLHVDPDLADRMEGVEVMSMVGAIAQVVGMAIVLAVFGWVLLAMFLSMVSA